MTAMRTNSGFGGWGMALVRTLAAKSRRRSQSRRGRVRLESLEVRLAPALAGNLFVLGTTVVYNGNFANNVITLSGTDSAFTIQDSAGTIISNVPGFSGGGTSVTGTVPSYIRTIAIQGQNGTDTIDVEGLLTSRHVILGATEINNDGGLSTSGVTETANLINVSSLVDTTELGNNVAAGPLTLNGVVNVNPLAFLVTNSLVSGDVTVNGSITGSQVVPYVPLIDAGDGNITVTGSINLAGGGGMTIGGNNINLHQVTDDGPTGIFGGGAVNLNGSLNTTGDVLIEANQAGIGTAGFTQVSGGIATTSSDNPDATGNFAVDIFVNSKTSGTGNATIRSISTGSNGAVRIVTQSGIDSGGAIINGDIGVVNVTTPGGGTLHLFAGAGDIDLTTSVSNFGADIFGAPNIAGSINITNVSGAPLIVVNATTSDGNIAISNNSDINVSVDTLDGGTFSALGATAGNVTLTTTNGGSVNLLKSLAPNNVSAQNALTINASGSITTDLVSLVQAPTINLSAPAGITANLDSATVLSAVADTGGVTITDDQSLTVENATSNAGAISLTTTGTNDLTVNGNVTTAGGMPISLTSGQNLNIESGEIFSDTGTISLFCSQNFVLDSSVTVMTEGTGSGGVVIDALGNSPTIDISGMVASADSIAIGAFGSGTALLNVAGTITSGGSTSSGITVSASGSIIMNVTGSILSSGTDPLSNGALSIDLTGSGTATILETGTIAVSGAFAVSAAGGQADVDLFGTTTAGGILNVDAGTYNVLTLPGSVTTAGSVDITNPGATTGASSIQLAGTVDATAGGITLSAAGVGDNFNIDAKLIVPSGNMTTISDTGSGEVYVITPSLNSVISITGSGGGNVLSINVPLGVVLMSDMVPMNSTYTFTGGYQQIMTSNIESEP